jgi:hypothetical protein
VPTSLLPTLPEPFAHDDAADGEGLHGPTGGAVNVSCCVVTPAALATCAEVASALPGHQATNDPSATVACTLLPSGRTSVTPVTPGMTCPCTNVYGCPPLVVRWACEADPIGPAPMPPSPITDVEDCAAPAAELPLNTCWDPVGCLYSIGGAGGECPSREKPLETDACVQSTGPQQSRQRSTAGERKTAAFQSPIEFWHPTGGIPRVR